MPASRAQRAATAERRTKAITMRLAGIDWDTIANRLDYSDRAAACKDVTRALEQRLIEQSAAVEVLRSQEAARLDRLQAAAWAQAIGGDLRAIDTAARLIAQRSRLLGLDAPAKLEVTTIDYLDREIRDTLDELARAEAAEAKDAA